jgi:hypothetical protein
MTKKGGIDVEPSIQRHGEVGPPMTVTFWKATDTMKPSMIPKAVHYEVLELALHIFALGAVLPTICHIMVSAPRMVFGAHSAAYTGVVLDLAPTAKPRANRAISRLTHVLAAAIQIPVTKEMKQEMKIVPLRPKSLFSGALVQQPIKAEQR